MTRPVAIGLLAMAMVAIAAIALLIGSSSIGWEAALAAPDIVWHVRLPRILLAGFAGAGLATAGVAFQALLRNPLADPYIVGVSGGAALGGVVALVLNIGVRAALPAFAFGGAVISALLLFGLARARGRADPLTLLLTGVVFNAFAAAVVTFFKAVVSATKAQEILYWLMGVISVESPTTLWVLGLYCTVGIVGLLLCSGSLNLLAMGDEDAQALGLNVERARLVAFLAAALLVGSVVAVAGMIGFVGLVVPHILRRLLGADHRWLIPAAALGGAAFLIGSDAIARLSFYFFGTEIPVGVVTASTGGPFFLHLLLRRRA